MAPFYGVKQSPLGEPQGDPAFGGPGRTRTPDLLIRSQPLYPAELRAQAEA